jgi:hypothetical protein
MRVWQDDAPTTGLDVDVTNIAPENNNDMLDAQTILAGILAGEDYGHEEVQFYTNRILANNDVITKSLFSGTIEAKKITVDEIDFPGLTTITGRLDVIENALNALTTINNQLTAVNDQFSTINTRITQLETHQITSGLQVNAGQIFADGLKVDTISAQGNAINFANDINFFGTPFFTKDTAGFATMRVGDRKVKVVFEKEYPVTPVVNASIAEGENADEMITSVFANDIKYIIKDRTTKGFTILLNQDAPTDIHFNWIAIAIKNPTTSLSESEAPIIINVPPFEPSPEPPTNTEDEESVDDEVPEPEQNPDSNDTEVTNPEPEQEQPAP